MKVIKHNLNDKSKLILVDDSHPENYLMVAPEEAETIEDLDIDLEHKTCKINLEKVKARKERMGI